MKFLQMLATRVNSMLPPPHTQRVLTSGNVAGVASVVNTAIPKTKTRKSINQPEKPRRSGILTASWPRLLAATCTALLFSLIFTQSVTAQTISNKTVAVGSSIEIDLDEVFSPAAGSTLIYTATTSAVGIVTADVAGSTLTVTGVAAGPGGGSVQIAVTPFGGQVVTFQVTVTALADAPVITAINTVLNNANEHGRICITFDGDVTFDRSPNASFLNAKARLTDFVLSSKKPELMPALKVIEFGGHCFVDSVTRENAIHLTLSRQIAFGETVTLSYTKSGTEHNTKGIRRDVIGGSEPLADFSDKPITNNAIAPIKGPELRAAGTFSANQIFLSFGLEVVTASPDLRAADFTVSGAASSPTVTGISGSSSPSALLLTLSANIVGGETITLSYTKTMGSISNASAEELVNFTDYSVTNTRPAPAPAPVTAPSISISPNTVTATAGTAIADITITSTGGAVASYSINPAIGNGLSFDTTTGTISGTPTAAATEAAYTITATNTAGTAIATVAITVNAAPIAAPMISITLATVTVTAGSTAITPITIASTGGTVASYSIMPDIGNGLMFDANTGTISGTPTAAAPEIIYTITATNTAGTAIATVAITVEAAADTTAPIITLTGDNPQTIELGEGYTELGATTDDGSEVSIDSSAFVDAVGTYSITYTATDGTNQATATRTVNVVDTTAPTITLTGDNPQTIEQGEGYTELGASADDGSTVSIDSSTFVDAVGTYTITYTATDGTNQATPVTRTVNVVDTTPPTVVITSSSGASGSTVDAETLSYTATFSEAVPGFELSDITVTGTANGGSPVASNLQGTGTTYTFDVVRGISDGTVIVSIAAGVAEDISGNGNIASNQYILTIYTGLTPDSARKLNENILPRLTHVMLGGTVSAVNGRMEAAFSGTSEVASYQIDGQAMQQKLPNYLKSLEDGTMDWKEMLSRSAFVMPLNAAGGAGSTAGATVWGGGDYNRMSGKFSDGDWEGDVLSAQLGIDQRLGKDMLAGGLVSWSKGDVDYNLTTQNGKETSGDYTHQITSVHPYFARSNDEVDLWGSVGYGQGKLAIKQQSPTEDSERSSDTRLLSLSAGGSGRLTQYGQSGLKLKSDIILAQVDIAESADKKIPADKLNSQRLRLLLEMGKERPLSSGGHFKPLLEVGLRYDGGVGESSGIGAVLNLGGHYANTTGLTVEGKLHTLLGQDDYQEWGIQGTIRQQANANGQGLSFSLNPSYGTVGISTNQVWQQELADDNNGTSTNSARLNVNMGYGLFTAGGLLTPYSEVSMSDSNHYRLGLRWKPSSPLSLHLYGERETSNNSDRILLEGRIRF